MPIDQQTLLWLVPHFNGAVAMISCPFALYEALSKRAGVTELKVKLDLRADQLLGKCVGGIEEVLLPFWPKSIATIILEPTMIVQATPGLSEAARDALTKHLAKSEPLWQRFTSVKGAALRILMFDRLLYWLIFCTAGISLLNLVLWAFRYSTKDRVLLSEILIPGALLAASLLTAAVRQALIQRAERLIIEQ